MSVPATNWVWSLNGDTLPNATVKLVLMKHADHAHDDGTHTWQVVETVAKFALCSPRTAQRANDWLLEHGYLREGDQSVIPDKYKNAKNKPVAYELAMNEATRLQWEVDAANGGNPIHDAAKAAGAKGAAKRAENQRAAKAQVKRGDNLSPQESVSTSAEITPGRGDNLSPQTRGDNGDAEGVTDRAGRGDTGVTQTTHVTTQGNPPSSNGAASPTTAPPTGVASGKEPEEKPTASKRGTRLSEDFASTITPEMVAWARAECPDVDGKRATESFVDFWTSKPGSGGLKLDWVKTWRNWMRTEQDRAASRRGRGGRGPAYSDERTWGPRPGAQGHPADPEPSEEELLREYGLLGDDETGEQTGEASA